MAKQNRVRPAMIEEPADPQAQTQKPTSTFVLPQQPSAIDQWADIFHIQSGPLGVRLWFGTTRGDSSGQTDIRTAVFLPGDIGRLFLAHARALAETQKIALGAKQPQPTVN